ncbi:NusG domain II-containing protein [bacterium]|nr:MAG: NusG domain II-containing protein [bacterium]
MVSKRLKLRVWDGIPIAIGIIIAWAPLFLLTGDGEKVGIVCAGEIIAETPLSRDTTIAFESCVGPIRIEVSDGYVSVVEASCPHKICVKTGKISRPGSAIICAPGRVAVFIEGETENDAITR